MVANEEIIWVCGFRISDKIKVTKKQVNLQIRFTRFKLTKRANLKIYLTRLKFKKELMK